VNVVRPYPGDIVQVLVNNLADVAAGRVLRVDSTVSAGTVAVGGLTPLSIGTVATSVADSVIRSIAEDYMNKGKFALLTSMASSSVNNSTLAWVKFL
jgi:hypothetical protein